MKRALSAQCALTGHARVGAVTLRLFGVRECAMPLARAVL
jgi:hypothetical protein